MDLRSTIRRDASGLHLTVEQVRLVFESGPRAGKSMVLGDQPLVIGREGEVDVTLADAGVSRLHARLVPTSEGWKVEDLGSSNGTRVNGMRVESAFLEDGAVIEVGDSRIVFQVQTVEVGDPRAAPGGDRAFPDLVGESPALEDLKELLRKVGPLPLSVLLLGESGTGKEALARAVHRLSEVSRGPYEVVDCTLLTGDHLRSELFGHVKGAFTGATSDRRGAFERASGGTVFLDEVGEIPLELQPQLLRVLEQGEVRPLGGERSRNVRVRVVSATHRDLEAMVRQGEFRQDLFYRLSAIRVEVPPLRERGDDPVVLAEHFLYKGLTLSPGARDQIRSYPWPGNVRELRNAVQRASALAEDRTVQAEHLGLPAGGPPSPAAASGPAVLAPGETRSLDETEAAAIRQALADCGGNRTEVARRLGISRSTLYAKLKKYQLLDP